MSKQIKNITDISDIIFEYRDKLSEHTKDGSGVRYHIYSNIEVKIQMITIRSMLSVINRRK